MGNYRFKLSDLIPNAWFYKMRDMGKSIKKQQKHQNSTVSSSPIKKHQTVPTPTTARSPRLPPRRSSSYYARPGKTAPSHTPRKSAGNRLRHRATTVSSAPKQIISLAECCRSIPPLNFSTTSGDSNTATRTESFSPGIRSDQLLIPDESLESSWHSPCSCVSSKLSKAATFTPPPELDLRPLITKPANKPTTVRKTSVSSPAGMRLRLRSPRISTRKSASSGARRTYTATTVSSRRSRAVVKASMDPRRDFKESMEEMIAENNIRTSKDLEELLACYLCLNSDEYHHTIINVFKQIWRDLNLPPHMYSSK